MSTPATNVSARRQRQGIRPPATGYIVTSARGHPMLVRRPDARPLLTRPIGRRVDTDRVESVQSYLRIPAA